MKLYGLARYRSTSCPCVTHEQAQKATKLNPRGWSRLVAWVLRHGWWLCTDTPRPLPGGRHE